jgi:hypothetical protein
MPQELVRRVLDLGNTPVPERYPGYRRGTLDLSGECGQVSSFLLNAARYFVRFFYPGPEVYRGAHFFTIVLDDLPTNTVRNFAKPLDIARVLQPCINNATSIR